MSMTTRRVADKAAAPRSIPLFFLGVGIVCLVAATVGGRPGLGLLMLGSAAVCGLALVLLGRRSETYRGVTGETDERFALMGRSAWATTGVVLTVANLGGLIGELVAGRSGSPFSWLMGLAAVSYVSCVGVLRQRL
ncbi:hypothetical protein [Streptomyces sp. ICBB 8177]|uniref:hypothetical protein n=1 Tax=Streptomyces sp. ICBB 8177 TaxID=563922 RepID=UPI001F53EB47|nr:hypothetical protein [Streptomyces sp. ICBB 8177]